MSIDPFATSKALIDEARLALRRGRFEVAWTCLQRFSATSAESAIVELWKLRVLAEQGAMGQAVELALRNLREPQPVADEVLALWSRFVLLLAKSDSSSEDEWNSFDSACSHAQARNDSESLAFAVALDLRARALLLRINLYQAPVSQRAEVVVRWDEAAEAYARIGQAVEARAIKVRSADVLRNPPLGDRLTARKKLIEVSEAAEFDGDALGQAEAALELAAMDLEEYLESPPAERSPEEDQARLKAFDNVARRLEASGHQFGEAKAGWRCARLLLLFGVEEGVTIAHQAIAILKEQGETTLRMEVWKQLATWHTYRGEFPQAAQAQRESESLAQQMQFGLATAVDVLSAADAAFRNGQLGQARHLLEEILENRPGRAMRHAFRFILSTTAAACGLLAEAKLLLQQILADLEALGPNSLSAQAEFQLASLYGEKEFEAAIACLDRAYTHYQALGDSNGKGQVLGHRAWLRVLYRYHNNQTPLVTPDSEADFDAALQLLNHSFTLERQILLGSFCQYRGQAASIDNDWDACGHWLESAKNIYRNAGLRPQLAFTLLLQGMACLQLARSKGTQLYDYARTRMEEAQHFFETSALWGVTWQVWFYRGVCDMEAARREAEHSPERQERRERAMQCFHESDWLITELRGLIQGGATHQEHFITFNVDKQTLYRQAFQLAWWELQDSAEAFVWLERMKGRVLLDALAAMTVPKEILGAHPQIQLERELTQKKKLASGTEEAMGIQREIDSLLDQLSSQKKTSTYATLRRSRPAGWTELQALLMQEQRTLPTRHLVVAEFFCEARQSLLFVMRADWKYPRVFPLDVDLASLQSFRNSSFPREVRMMLEDRGEEPWQMYRGLIAPLEEVTSPGDLVCLIPHGLLHDLPLHTLHLNSEALIERNPVFYSPSASVLAHTQGRTQHDSGGSCAKRSEIFGDSRQDLPGARQEAEIIARRFGQQAHLGDDVTRQRLLTAFAQSDFVHFAGHGEVSATSGFESGLHLAGGDFLRAKDLIGVSSQAELVTLSGCETGLNHHHGGDELLGLVRMFLYAGVGSLLVSQWRVNDAFTQELLTSFYSVLGSGVSKAEALHMAVRKVRQASPQASFYHWGSFILVGDWK